MPGQSGLPRKTLSRKTKDKKEEEEKEKKKIGSEINERHQTPETLSKTKLISLQITLYLGVLTREFYQLCEKLEKLGNNFWNITLENRKQ